MRPSIRMRRGCPISRFTLLELLLVTMIIALLASLLLPALGKARNMAVRTTCASNLKNIGYSFTLYVNDYHGQYPAADDPVSTSPSYWLWMGRGFRGAILPYLGKSYSVLYCPADTTAPQDWESTSYGYSMAMYHSPAQINAMADVSFTYDAGKAMPAESQYMAKVRYPSRKVLAAEWLSNHDRLPEGEDGGWWCWKGTRNALFCDGHVTYLPAEEVIPAQDGLPDFNLTVDGSRGKDVGE